MIWVCLAEAEANMLALQRAARITAYLIVLLLALVWAADGAVSLTNPLFDIARPHVGDAIIKLGRLLGLSPEGTITLAHTLAGLKVFIGVYLFITVVGGVLDWARNGTSDDAMFDVGLMVSAVASLIAAIPVAGLGGEPLQGLIGELMLAAIASALAIYGRGFIVAVEIPPLRRGPETFVISPSF